MNLPTLQLVPGASDDYPYDYPVDDLRDEALLLQDSDECDCCFGSGEIWKSHRLHDRAVCPACGGSGVIR